LVREKVLLEKITLLFLKQIAEYLGMI